MYQTLCISNKADGDTHMQNEDQIVSFILGCGTDVVLLSPEYLVNKVKNKAIEIKNQYENVGTYYEKN